MNTLPFDYCRCNPLEPDEWCKKCARYTDHPKQVWGPRTPLMSVKGGYNDEACMYIPDTLNVRNNQND